jgi:ketosteroid isomerase-like protein
MKQISKIVLFVGVPVLLLAACGQASKSPSINSPVTPSPIAENVEQVLSKMEQDWVGASLKKDIAFVDSLLADDYVGIGSDGSVWTKPKQIEVLRSGELKFDSVSIDGIKVRAFGDTAVVTYSQTEKSRFQGKDSSGRTMWTDIFVKRNGKWQLVANHSSRVEQPKK